MPLVMAATLVLSAPAMAHGTGGHSHAHAAHNRPDGEIVSAARLFVADAGAPRVTVLDAHTGETLAAFELDTVARIHRGASIRTVVATLRDANAAAFIDTGLSLENHGDHFDLSIAEARLLDGQVEGATPAHVNRGAGEIAIFFDGDGVARILSEQSLLEGGNESRLVETATPHHGLVKPAGQFLAISAPTVGERLPDGVKLVDRKGETIVAADCQRMHGEGQSGAHLAFGCADGVAVFDLSGPAPETRHLAYPAEFGDGRMVRNMAGAEAYTAFLADFGHDGMIVVDPRSEESFNFVQLPGRRMHFALATDPGDTGFVMIEDGTLIKLNALTGAIVGKTEVTARYSMEQGILRPRVSTAGGLVAVTDPAAGVVVVVDAGNLAVLSRIAVGGNPADVVLVHAAGERH